MDGLAVGVYKVSPEDCYLNVLSALRLGYRHIDTARVYKNEEAVGAAIRDSGVDRAQIFVTSKVWLKRIERQKDKATTPQDQVIREAQASAHRLGTYMDLYLLHAPMQPISAYWQGMEAVMDLGIARRIGVSNFGEAHLRSVMRSARVTPFANQLELNPFRQQRSLCEFCRDNGIEIVAHTPLCHGQKFGNATIAQIAEAHAVDEAQVMIRYGLQKGWVVVPKAVSLQHLQANYGALSMQDLTPHEMSSMDELEEGLAIGWDPVTWNVN